MCLVGCVIFYLFSIILRADALGENMSLEYLVIHFFQQYNSSSFRQKTLSVYLFGIRARPGIA